jgi:hypothetical protein
MFLPLDIIPTSHFIYFMDNFFDMQIYKKYLKKQIIPQLSQGYRIESLQQEMNSIKANEETGIELIV